MSKFCAKCGTSLPDEAEFCFSCGQPQHEATESVAVTSAEEYFAVHDDEENVKNKRSRVIIARNSLILAIAVILFALSFAPFVKAKQSISLPTEDYGMNIEFDTGFDFNSIDTIIFFFDSFKSANENTLINSEFTEKIDTLQGRLAYEMFVSPTGKIKLTDEGQDMMNDIMKLSMRLVFQSNLYTTGPTVVLPFIASVVYILLTFAFLIFASRNFILGLGRTEKHDDKAYSHSIKLLAGIPGVLLARYSSYFLYVGFRNTFMAWGTILSLILSGAAIITLIALAFFRKWHERKINIPLRIATCVLSVIAICMTFVPIMKTTINAEFSGTNTESEITIPIYPSLIAGFDMTELQWSEINDIRGGDERQKKRDFYIILNNFEDYTKPQINSGLADEDNMKYLIYMTAVDKSDSFITMISMTSFVYYAFAIFLSMVLQENLRCLIDGKYSRIQSRIGKIAGLVCACAILAVTLVLLDVIVDSLYIYSSKRYSIALSAGSILTVVFAAASLVIPGEKKNAVVVCDADNDEEEEEDEEDEED